MSEAIGSGLGGSERCVVGSGRIQLEGSVVSWADTLRSGWTQDWEPRGCWGRAGEEDHKNSDAPHHLLDVPPSSHSPFSPFFSFMRSEGFVGCRGQKAFTEKVKLQSDLKESHISFQSQQGGDQCGNIVFLVGFYKLPVQSSLFSFISTNTAQLLLVVIFALRFTSVHLRLKKTLFPLPRMK